MEPFFPIVRQDERASESGARSVFKKITDAADERGMRAGHLPLRFQ